MSAEDLHSEENKPIPSERYAFKYRGVKCLNCDHPLDLSDRFCSRCSQVNSTKKISFKDLLDEFFSSIISYDSKLRKTLASLIIKPGKITREYVSGKRVNYTNPFRFLLSLAIVYFLMFNFSNNLTELDRFGLDSETPAKINLGFNEINVESLDKKNKELIDKAIDTIQGVEALKKNLDSIRLLNPNKYFRSLDSLNRFNRYANKSEFFEYAIRKKKLFGYNSALDSLKVPDTFENKIAFGTGRSMGRVARQPGSYLSYLISKIPFVIFFFLPVFALFIWLIYSKKNFSYMDHLIFSFHTQSMFIILLIIAFIISSLFKIDLMAFFILIFLFYLYKAMRNFYKQRRFKTIVKFLLLNTIFFTLAIIIGSLFFVGSIFIY